MNSLLSCCLFPGARNTNSQTKFNNLNYAEQLKSHNYKQNKRKIPYLFYQNTIQTKAYMIYFHGNAEDLFGASQLATSLMVDFNINLIVVEYPGYGVYKGYKTEISLIEEDAIIVYDYVTSIYKIQQEHLYIFGRSLGSGPAVYLAGKRKCQGLILQSPYKSIRDMINEKTKGLLGNCFDQSFDNMLRIQHIQCELCLIIHGKKDDVIKHQNSIDLHQEFINQNKNAELELRDNMTHNEFNFAEDIINPIANRFPEIKAEEDEAYQ